MRLSTAINLGALLLWPLCAPSLAGCPTEPLTRCDSDADCRADELCRVGRCRAVCNSRRDCGAGETCLDGLCWPERPDSAAIDLGQEDAPRGDVAAADLAAPDRLDASSAADQPRADTRPPDAALPETSMPDTSLPDTLLPDSLLPDTSQPDTLLPDTLLPDTLLPDTLLPDTLLPDTLLPDTLLPDALLPDTLQLLDPVQQLEVVDVVTNWSEAGIEVPESVTSGDLLLYAVRTQSEQEPEAPPPSFQLLMQDRPMDSFNAALQVYVDPSATSDQGGLVLGALPDGDWTDRVVMVLRPDRPANLVRVLGYARHITAEDPEPITVDSSAAAAPALLLGYTRNTGMINEFTVADPPFDSMVSAYPGVGRWGLKLYNSAPQDHQLDVPDRAATYNLILGFVLDVK